MPTDFNDLAYFGINNVQIDEKCWNCGVTFSLRTIFNFEQCVGCTAITRYREKFQGYQCHHDFCASLGIISQGHL